MPPPALFTFFCGNSAVMRTVYLFFLLHLRLRTMSLRKVLYPRHQSTRSITCSMFQEIAVDIASAPFHFVHTQFFFFSFSPVYIMPVFVKGMMLFFVHSKLPFSLPTRGVERSLVSAIRACVICLCEWIGYSVLFLSSSRRVREVADDERGRGVGMMG